MTSFFVLLLVVVCGGTVRAAFAKTVDKLCKSVLCKIDVKSTDGVGLVAAVAVVVVVGVLAAAADDN